ncbi:TPA: hypothetical protein PXM39_003593 [Yersinia enterocolitica]|nr:hypothetical protein [Yersinia enterocolitica]HDL6900986.1 hypothetical protein [Yersinia enterocolitica]HDL7092092.1 hypothetical protein [Yersinia enterocolitica]HDL7101130.1 hypothetical protein [Yersinia enterocolitica]HDL7135612.1 hypothetical protein [Yersinia enterocolitica]
MNNWPDGDAMTVVCPHCSNPVDTQIAMVKENKLQLRPEHCQFCYSDFEVYPDGKTNIINHGLSNKSSEKGRKTIEETIIFNPTLETEQFKVNLSEWIKQEKAELGENAFYHPNTEYFKVLNEINQHEIEFIANSGDLVEMAVKHSLTFNQLTGKDKKFVKFYLEEEILNLID